MKGRLQGERHHAWDGTNSVASGRPHWLKVSRCITIWKSLTRSKDRKGNTADPAKGCGQVCGLLYENMYMFFYRWYPDASFSCSKGSITASSNLTVYKLKPVNKLQYLTRDVLAITPRPPNFNVGHDANTRRFCFLVTKSTLKLGVKGARRGTPRLRVSS